MRHAHPVDLHQHVARQFQRHVGGKHGALDLGNYNCGDVLLASVAGKVLNKRDSYCALIVEIREAGWAAVDQELEEGVRSAAVPIRDTSGRVIAALNMSVHATRMTMPALRREVVPRLLRTAEAIEVDLSVSGGPASAVGGA